VTDPEEVLVVRCRVCGAEYLTDQRDQGATMLHLPSGAHRLIPAQGAGPDSRLQTARVEVLAIAVRLADLVDDLERVLGLLGEVDDVGH
jgi:hypothetical protein